MCGICGGFGIDNSHQVIQKMTDAMIHRGPDSDGYFQVGDLSLGMRRLKIIDLDTGDQPIFNEAKNIALVCNGEIYNYQEIRETLIRTGHHFATKSDTEVIVHAYEEWGVEFLCYIRGMFSIAIVDFSDEANVLLLLARDRFGIKPLYYYNHQGQFIFASEVKALLSSGIVNKNISLAGLYTYLSFGSVQEPLTLVDGIVSIPPASCMVVNTSLLVENISISRYWEPSTGEQLSPDSSQVRMWLEDAISSHLISDVPLGSFLSGGIDSGSIVAFASNFLGEGLNTFTLGFDNWSNDESEFAELTAKKWKTCHHHSMIDESEVINNLPNVIDAMDEPTVDGINTWFVSREARKSGLVVALSGIGGDEIFAGYPSFTLVPKLSKFPRLPIDFKWLNSTNLSAKLLGKNYDSFNKLFSYMTGNQFIDNPYFAVRGLFTNTQIKKLLNMAALNRLDQDNYLSLWKTDVEDNISIASSLGPVSSISWLELTQYMKSTLLRDTDMMSMAHSLEVRVPFLDHSLVQQVLSVNPGDKVNHEYLKPLLVGATKGFLPSPIMSQKKKTFTFPFEYWLRKNLNSHVARCLTNPSGILSELFEYESLKLTWERFTNKQTNWARPWSLFILEEWCKRNL